MNFIDIELEKNVLCCGSFAIFVHNSSFMFNAILGLVFSVSKVALSMDPLYFGFFTKNTLHYIDVEINIL